MHYNQCVINLSLLYKYVVTNMCSDYCAETNMAGQVLLEVQPETADPTKTDVKKLSILSG